MSELRQPEADLQAPVPAQGPVEAPLLGAAGEEAASPSSSVSPGAPSASAECLPQEALVVLMADLVAFLLVKYRTGQPTSEAEMLSTVFQEHGDHFPVVFSLVCECMLLVFGLDVKEVGPRERTYVLVPTLGLTWDAMLSNGQHRPEAGLLVLVLTMITLFGDRIPAEEVWGVLGNLGMSAGRELLTKVWVQTGYLQYRQVPHSDPARYEFLWGPRAYAETSKWQVLQHLLSVCSMDPRSFPSLSAEGVSDEEEGAAARPAPSSFSRGAGREAGPSL
ncbi:PREDICTED: melanoma-associated antigen 10-like [Lipotes vexillifer]|uniref:Melanoma-associated antigen 10-like n=1 Tax=Lipotes vexillifer TaxID=118797 RepID=A0A340YE27_LIPVE|nr:PREDICTED: melanoma-associated antigen 10-like [Lipotes vexillifer]